MYVIIINESHNLFKYFIEKVIWVCNNYWDCFELT